MESCVRLEPTPDGRASILPVRAQPGARRPGVRGVWNGMLQVAVAAPPEDGRANDALARDLARILGVSASAVRLLSGERSRAKRFRVGLAPAVLSAKIDRILADLV